MRRFAVVVVVSCLFGVEPALAQAGTSPPRLPGSSPADVCENDSDCEEGEVCGSEGVCVRAEDNAESTPPLQIHVGTLRAAEEAPGLSDAQIRWLKPRRNLMDQVPRAQTDFTAYALEFGEVRVGLAKLTIGAAPRVQVATVPLLWMANVQNAQIKANPVRFGGFDAAVEGSLFSIPLDDFDANYKDLGAVVSLQVLEKLSLHGGVSWAWLNFGGAPQGLLPLADNAVLISKNEDLGDFVAQIEESDELSGVLNDGEISIEADALLVRFALDYRFNRRDSLVVQFQAMVSGNAKGNVELPPILGLEDALSVNREGSVSASDAYITSLAWHSAWKRWEFRLGAGLASQQGAWLFQAMDISYRFGGETRTSERRTRNTWRRNRGDQGKGDQEF